MGNPYRFTFSFDHGLVTGDVLNVRFVGGDFAGQNHDRSVRVTSARAFEIETAGGPSQPGLGQLPSGFVRFREIPKPIVIPDLDIPENFPITLERRLAEWQPLINLDIPDFENKASTSALPTPGPGNAAQQGLIEATNLSTPKEQHTSRGWWLLLAAAAAWILLKK